MAAYNISVHRYLTGQFALLLDMGVDPAQLRTAAEEAIAAKAGSSETDPHGGRPIGTALAPLTPLEVPTGASLRSAIVHLLNGFDGTTLSILIGQVDGAYRQDAPHLSPPDRVAKLLSYVESSVSPVDYNGLRRIILDIWPDARFSAALRALPEEPARRLHLGTRV